MLIINPEEMLPGNEHEVAPGRPDRVVRSLKYRMSWADIVTGDDARFGPLTAAFPDEYRPAGTFGIAGAESQEHSVLWLGDPAVIAGFRDDPEHRVPWAALHQQGIWSDRWPDGDAWSDFIPAGTWCPGGQGIVTEYDFAGAKVIVYEVLGRPTYLSLGPKGESGKPVPVVTFHCTRCHAADTRDHRYTSASPEDRRAACQAARRHMLPGQCGGPAAAATLDRMTAVVDSLASGAPASRDSKGMWAAACPTWLVDPDDLAANSTCAEILQARGHAA